MSFLYSFFCRRVMRMRRVATAALLAFFCFSGAATLRNGTARLVSIEEGPEVGEMCEWVPASAVQAAGLEQTNLFSVFGETAAYAASQEPSSTAGINRPALRNILDTDPIYSSVAVDTPLHELFLQDTNTKS